MIRTSNGRFRPATFARHAAHLAAFAVGSAVFAQAPDCPAQIGQPGRHIRYAVELEPQVALHIHRLPGEVAGIGPGLRLTVPIIADGPLKSINNSLAVAVGFNYAYFKETCGAYYWTGGALGSDDPDYATYVTPCSAHQFGAPVVLQWNFWLSNVFSVFAEPGMAFLYQRRSGTGWCDGDPCDKKDSETRLPFVFWGGARMAMSESFALTIRLGTPYVSAGASMFF